jgi:predicted peroxiredoxin
MHLFVNLTSNDAGRVSKALRMANRFAGAGWDVTLYMNVDGVHVARGDRDPGACPVTGKPLLALLEALSGKGEVLVGADCLQAAGVSPDTVREGLALSDPATLIERMARPETRVVSY